MLLNCHTSYSYRYGTFSIDELRKTVEASGYTKFALTDINNTSAWIEMARQCEKTENIQPVFGIDFRNGIRQQYVGLARNNQGLYELSQHLSQHLKAKQDFEQQAPAFQQVYIVYPFATYQGWPLSDNECIGISVQDLVRLPFSPHRRLTHKMVILQTLSFAGKAQFNAHRLLRAIDQNTLLSKLSPSEQSVPAHTIISKEQLQQEFNEYPAIIQNTHRLLDDCNASFDFGKFSNKNLRHYTGSATGDLQKLRAECEINLHYRYSQNMTPLVAERLQKELDIIAQMHFASYFLVNWDIVTYARHKGYYHVGRGSGANSIVAYLLRITDVDPIELDLYFERFINPYRSNPPDFDIDFSWTDRDDITDYIFETFNKNNNVALVGSYNTFQHDAVVRQLGKVFGLPPAEIDKLQKTSYHEADNIGQTILKYSKHIEGLPSHLSIHASGILISEESLYNYSALEVPPKGYATTQFSMLEAEDIGLYKFDILSQRGLGKIKDALGIIAKNHKHHIDIHQVKAFTQDEKVKDLLRIGNTIGCFYVESPAMRMLLAKLQADDYLRLVAASSIIRPGVAKSGMMREYILRYRNQHLREKARAEIPELYDLLKETYGVMVYQEDVIKIAHFFANLSLAEADRLRRGMSWKFKHRDDFMTVRKLFFENCRKKEMAEDTITNIWMQIESFANFAFSKGHSASYAVESYQALYLKAYYPLEYMVATLNNGGGFYRTELYLHEARMKGGTVEPPCVNRSTALSQIIGKTIFLGLAMIKELGEETIHQLLKERETNGPFASLQQFIRRVSIGIEQLRLLIRIGAFNFTGINRKELLWEAHARVNPLKKTDTQAQLFEPEEKVWELPELYETPLDNAFDEMELLGFPLCSPFDLLRNAIPTRNTMKTLAAYVGQTVAIVGYMINIKVTYTSGGDRMYFGTFTDLDGQWIDTVHFPPVAKAFPFTGPGCYHITGKLTKEYDFTTIEVETMSRLAVVNMENVEIKTLGEKRRALIAQRAGMNETNMDAKSMGFNHE